ncbi:hypothetical protein ACQP2X_33235 [Actinoplanes sp. CA-131856]
MTAEDGRGVSKRGPFEELVLRGVIEAGAQSHGRLIALMTGPAAPVVAGPAVKLIRGALVEHRTRERAEEKEMSWDEYRDRQDEYRRETLYWAMRF